MQTVKTADKTEFWMRLCKDGQGKELGTASKTIGICEEVVQLTHERKEMGHLEDTKFSSITFLLNSIM